MHSGTQLLETTLAFVAVVVQPPFNLLSCIRGLATHTHPPCADADVAEAMMSNSRWPPGVWRGVSHRRQLQANKKAWSGPAEMACGVAQR